jgi:hypothetical protein
MFSRNLVPPSTLEEEAAHSQKVLSFFRLHIITSQKTAISAFTAMRISILTSAKIKTLHNEGY